MRSLLTIRDEKIGRKRKTKKKRIYIWISNFRRYLFEEFHRCLYYYDTERRGERGINENTVLLCEELLEKKEEEEERKKRIYVSQFLTLTICIPSSSSSGLLHSLKQIFSACFQSTPRCSRWRSASVSHNCEIFRKKGRKKGRGKSENREKWGLQ